jgi:hypothetical protein
MDAFGVDREGIFKSVARGISQIQQMSTRTVARTGQHPKLAFRAKQAMNGGKQVETPANAARKLGDAKNAGTSAMQREMRAMKWRKAQRADNALKQYPKK